MVKRSFKFLTILLISFVFITGCDAPKVEKVDNVIDGINFKTEYEKFNGEKLVLEIEKENPFKYLTEDNVLEVISSSSIIYFGYPDSNLCRGMVDILLELAKDEKIDNIYYMNVLDNRASYEIIDDELKEVKEGTSVYYKIIKYLGSNLDNLVVEENEQIYETLEKGINAPALLFIKDGNIVSYYDDFHEFKLDEFVGFGEKDILKIKEDLSNLIEKIKN